MQQADNKKDKFLKILGNLIKQIREKNGEYSIRRLADEYDLDRGNLSKIERGINCCNVVTLWKICEANDIKFSEFGKILEDELGNDFSFSDD